MNTKYKFFLLFLLANIMYLISSPNTKAEDVCVDGVLALMNPAERESYCTRACKNLNPNFKWNENWGDEKSRNPSNQCPHAYSSICGCTPLATPLNPSNLSCHEKQVHCLNPRGVDCARFKNATAQEHCRRGLPNVFNPHINCYNGCIEEQKSGNCSQAAPCQKP